MKTETIPVIIRGVDRETWNQFRKICIDLNVSANSLLKEMIDNAVRERTANAKGEAR